MSTKVSALSALLGTDVSASDVLYIVDVSAGTSGGKKITVSELVAAIDKQANAFTSTVTTTDGVSSGTARKVGGIAFANTAASTAITGATETLAMFDQSYTMPANTMKAGTVIRIRGYVYHTATTGSETHDMFVKLGSVVLVQKTGIDPATNDTFSFDVIVTCFTAGSSGTYSSTGTYAVGATGSGAYVKSDNSGSIDTTAANIIGVWIDRQSSATDSDSARLQHLVVEIYG